MNSLKNDRRKNSILDTVGYIVAMITLSPIYLLAISTTFVLNVKKRVFKGK